MIQVDKDLLFNPKSDSADVDQFGFIDLREAYMKHIIPADVAEGNDNYNDMDEPDTVGAKPSDVFEAYRMRDEIGARERAKQSKAQNEPAGE